jgi:PAS domain S-box-containing protein
MTSQEMHYHAIQHQQRYQKIFEHVPIGIVYFDNKGVVTHVNSFATHIFGRTKEEFLGLNLLQRLQDEKLKDAVQNVLILGDAEYEGYYYPVNGYQASHLQITFKALYNEVGMISAAVGLVQDVTEEKEAKKALSHYMHMVDATQDMMAYIDKDFNYIAVNKAYLAFHNCKEEEIINQHLSKIVGEKNFKNIQPLLQRALDGEVFSLKQHYELSDGSTVYEEGHFSPYINEDGNINGIVVSIRDITQQEIAKKEAHRHIKHSQHYLALLPVMILVLDHGANIVQINQKGCEILGYKQEELIGKNWIDTCIPAHLHNEIHLTFSQVMKNEIDYPIFHTNAVLTKSGEERIIAWRNVTIKDEDGKILEILSSGEDVTNQS